MCLPLFDGRTSESFGPPSHIEIRSSGDNWRSAWTYASFSPSGAGRGWTFVPAVSTNGVVSPSRVTENRCRWPGSSRLEAKTSVSSSNHCGVASATPLSSNSPPVSCVRSPVFASMTWTWSHPSIGSGSAIRPVGGYRRRTARNDSSFAVDFPDENAFLASFGVGGTGPPDPSSLAAPVENDATVGQPRGAGTRHLAARAPDYFADAIAGGVHIDDADVRDVVLDEPVREERVVRPREHPLVTEKRPALGNVETPLRAGRRVPDDGTAVTVERESRPVVRPRVRPRGLRTGANPVGRSSVRFGEEQLARVGRDEEFGSRRRPRELGDVALLGDESPRAVAVRVGHEQDVSVVFVGRRREKVAVRGPRRGTGVLHVQYAGECEGW